MAPGVVVDDYYAILGLVMTADTHAIKTAYRKLAKVTHPDRNPSPNSKEEFQRLQAAYETLADPMKRKAYDATRSRTCTSGTTPRQERGTQFTETAPRGTNAARERALEQLQAQLSKQDMEIFGVRRTMRKLQAEISQLQREDAAETREATTQAGWWGNVSSFVFGVGSRESAEVREERERRRLNRAAAIRIKETELSNKTNRLSVLEIEIAALTAGIENMKKQIRTEEQRQETERQRQRWEEMLRRSREADVELERERKQRERKEQERREREQREREQRERERIQREREQRQRKARELQQFYENVIRGWGERKRAEQGHKEQQEKMVESHNCLHEGWWRKIPGPAVCSVCSERMGRFLLQCPGCRMEACASCRGTVRGART